MIISTRFSIRLLFSLVNISLRIVNHVCKLKYPTSIQAVVKRVLCAVPSSLSDNLIFCAVGSLVSLSSPFEERTSLLVDANRCYSLVFQILAYFVRSLDNSYLSEK